MIRKRNLFCICILALAVINIPTVAPTPLKTGPNQGKKCPSVCIRDAASCKEKGGHIVGYCVDGLACCDLTSQTVGTCGDSKKGDQVTFVSPFYPNFRKNDLVCSFSMPLWEDTLGIKIEFLDVVMDGVGYTGKGCDSDMFYIKGFKTWTPPPFCANLTGYTTVIERTLGSLKMSQLILVSLMSSEKYRWKVKLTQIRPLHKGTKQQQETESKGNGSGKVSRDSSKSSRKRLRRTPLTGRQSLFGGGDETNEHSDPDLIFNQGDGEGSVDDMVGIENPMIVNGQDTWIKDVPWQVSIRQKYIPEVMDSDSNDNVTGNISSTSTTELPLSTTEPEVPPRNCSAEQGNHFCGGSIISDRHILTAAHCFYGNSKMYSMTNLNTIKIVLGDTDACTEDFPSVGSPPGGNLNLTEQEYGVDTVVLHYAYDPTALLNDVAVIKLKTKIRFIPSIKRIKMARMGELFDGRDAVSSGWGRTNLTDGNLNLPYVLQSSRRFVVRNSSECNNETERLFGAPLVNVTRHPKYAHAFQSLVCTGTGTKGANPSSGVVNGSSTPTPHPQAKVSNWNSNSKNIYANAPENKMLKEVHVGEGDSGGPLVTESKNGEFVLIGVVSYGIPTEEAKDAGDTIDFFQSVAYFRNWIEMAMTV